MLIPASHAQASALCMSMCVYKVEIGITILFLLLHLKRRQVLLQSTVQEQALAVSMWLLSTITHNNHISIQFCYLKKKVVTLSYILNILQITTKLI